LVAIAYFGLLFWLVDRFRRRRPQPIVPTSFETPWMLGSYGLLTFAGVTAIFRFFFDVLTVFLKRFDVIFQKFL
jgi:hypothetical protein